MVKRVKKIVCWFYFALYLMLLPSLSLACSCQGNCLDKEYDLTAVVEIVGENTDYSNAFNAKVHRIMGYQKSAVQKDSPMYKLLSGDTDEILVVSGGPRTTDVRVRNYNSCSRDYLASQKLYFFAIEVEPGVFQSDQCTCSMTIR